MKRTELYASLESAQDLLNEIFSFACSENLPELARLMSVADTMICESFEEIECGETAKHFGDE
jgi:predicted house-cleaning noncanonical NTP pyrophosphatase (MazG superfamily)